MNANEARELVINRRQEEENIIIDCRNLVLKDIYPKIREAASKGEFKIKYSAADLSPFVKELDDNSFYLLVNTICSELSKLGYEALYSPDFDSPGYCIRINWNVR